MKIDFEKFNLSQKIYFILGVVFAILIYMSDEEQLNKAIGMVFLTAVVVFLLKYQAAKMWINISVLIYLSLIVYLGLESYLPKKSEQTPDEYVITNPSGAVFIMEGVGTPRENEIEHLVNLMNQQGRDFLQSGKWTIKKPNHFVIGDSNIIVQAVQGTPSSIIGNMWYYGSDTVTFDDKRKVTGYMNNSGSLKVRVE